MRTRPDGKTAITILLNEQDVETLHLIMEADSRETMADCVRAIVRNAAKKFCADYPANGITAPARAKRAAAGRVVE